MSRITEECDAMPPPPPPPLPADVVPLKADVLDKPPQPKRLPTARPGFARKGQPIQLQTNHFKVNFGSVDGDFYHYSVALAYEDDRPINGKGIGRRVIDRLCETYESELGGKDFAYDGEKTLFTVGPLPNNKNDFTVVLEDLPKNR